MTLYLWLKAFHIIGVVCWFAGIFYLPRLFVYHATATDQPSLERFKVMEEKLYRIIMRPAMIVSVVLGIWLVIDTWESYSTSVWLWSKIAIVVVLLGYHHYLGKLIKRFATDNNPHNEKFYRWFNEIPVLLLILIVILVVVKPF
ncbi:MAG: protoporphyrinogen oxidase HemJ [Gammaproteobacteria bacterium]|nr:protoporphyrinogen oxidase HemJ [Gammaproteobacteria bacterium]